MKRLYSNKLSVAIVGLSVAIIAITAVAGNFYIDDVEEYVLTVNNEQLHFIAQPEAGYVLKTRDDISSMDSTSRFLKSAGDVKISPIRGLGRKGVCVVYNERTTDENDKTIKSLRVHSEVLYTAPLFSYNSETVAVIPEIVVRVKPGTEIEQVQAICETVGCSIIKRMEFTEQEYLIEVLGTDAEAVFVAVEELSQAPEVEWACPNTAFQPMLYDQAISGGFASGGQLQADVQIQDVNDIGVFPNDEYFPMQWHLHNTGQFGGTPDADINAPEAWEITAGDPNIVIAVIDCGVDSKHPDLVNNLVAGYDFWEDDDLPDPDNTSRLDTHGTECAGIAAAEGNNGIGVVGVAWKCKVMPIRDGTTGSYISWAEEAEAFRWAAANGADILSNSWGVSSPIPVLHSAIVDITKVGGIGRDGKGCVVFACAGNQGEAILYPAAYPEVIAVGATDCNDARWSYSKYGPELDLMAPSGCDGEWCGSFATLWTTDLTGSQGNSIFNDDPNLLDYSQYWGGTSVSCPIAAGVAALILSVEPNLTNIEVQLILERSARDLGEPGRDDYYGWGRVDARAALEMVLNPPSSIYVDDDATNDPAPGDPNISDPNENGSAEHPFDSIQKAIDYALSKQEIIVLPGRYTGAGNRDIDFGGKGLTVRSESGPTTCVIDCQGLGRGFYFHSGEGPNSVVEGLTIINGMADNGGAIKCSDNSSPTINNCIFQNNSAPIIGGAVYLSDSNTVMRNCTFSDNTAGFFGGAVCYVSGTMTLINCILWGDSPDEIYSVAEPNVQYCNVQGGFEGDGNIDADPLFADIDNGDYHLKSQIGRWDSLSESWVIDEVTSPCIDAGDPNSPIGLEPEPNGGRINMGAYGGTVDASKSP